LFSLFLRGLKDPIFSFELVRFQLLGITIYYELRPISYQLSTFSGIGRSSFSFPLIFPTGNSYLLSAKTYQLSGNSLSASMLRGLPTSIPKGYLTGVQTNFQD
jgi:hypothetical protein